LKEGKQHWDFTLLPENLRPSEKGRRKVGGRPKDGLVVELQRLHIVRYTTVIKRIKVEERVGNTR